MCEEIKCPFCDGTLSRYNEDVLQTKYDCPNCGYFSLDHNVASLKYAFGKVLHKEKYDEKNPCSEEEFLRSKCWMSYYIRKHPEEIIIVDEDYIKRVLESSDIPRTPEEKIITLLRRINEKTNQLGEYVNIVPYDVCMINNEELNAYCKELLASKLIKINQRGHIYSETIEHTEKWHSSPHLGGTGGNPIYLPLQENEQYLVSITIDGIRYLSEKFEGTKNDKCFIAMWFEESNNKNLYEKMIKPACFKAGYQSERVDFPSDLKNFSGDIYSEIIKFIRTTYFTIVDLTGNRSSVTYEAGFAEGLGKKVIYTANEETKENLPFDLSHKRILMWKKDDPDGFIQKLTNEIISIMGTGPLYKSE